MKSLSKSIRSLALAAAALLLPAMLASCQWMKEDFDDEIADSAAARYINITVSVSASNEAVTRATPLGGEYGDGWEKGFDRENEVENITLIFYKDANGINSDQSSLSEEQQTKILAVKKYDVHKLEAGELPESYTHNHTHTPAEPSDGYAENEVIYTTGDQILSEADLDVFQTNTEYHVIVVANADPNVTAGMTLAQARDVIMTTAYEGTGVATDASKFVMSSERDATIKLVNPTVVETENKFIYYLDCIHIERLAARIDFWAKTKDPDATTTSYMSATYDADKYDHAGYVYNVGKKDTDNKQDHFVLTSITPFNLMNGNEYMLKRTNDATNKYLASETLENWVLDPYSAANGGKNSETAHPTYLTSTLTTVKALNETNWRTYSKTVMLSNRQTLATETTEGGKFTVKDNTNTVSADNIIISYTKENTLNNGTRLYYYATGLAFEGYYYKKDATKDESGKFTGGERRVFYHYLIHQGDADVYQALTQTTLNDTDVCPNSPAMKYGIVRNNIYRVCIESINADETEELYVKLLIKVKKWDKFVHTPIIM